MWKDEELTDYSLFWVNRAFGVADLEVGVVLKCRHVVYLLNISPLWNF